VIVTVTANPSVDRTYRLGELRPGALNRASDVLVEPSGKGINVSRVLAALGAPTRAVVTTGGWEGRQLIDLLAAGGLTARPVPVAGATRVNVTVLPAGTEPTKINEPGGALSDVEVKALATAVREALSEARWLACCGSLPAGTPPEVLGRLVAEARRTPGVRVAVDSSGAALAAAVEAGADLVKPNADELAELTGQPTATTADACRAALAVARRTGGEVLASLGPAGAVLATPNAAWLATGPTIAPVNTTGAGDALLAGYLAAALTDNDATGNDTTGNDATGSAAGGRSATGEAAAKRLARAVAVATSACLSAATAGLPDELVPPGAVTVRRLAEDGSVAS
jgi:1-phosphofructokinase